MGVFIATVLSEKDLSNCRDYEQFFEHYAFVVRELARITVPGRMTAVHCMDVPTGNTGTDGLIDFPGDIIRLHEREGWKYIARYAIWKEPLAVRNRTMAKNLAHKTIVEDSADAPVASADYLLAFPAQGREPVRSRILIGASILRRRARDAGRTSELSRTGCGNQIEGNPLLALDLEAICFAFWDDVRIGRVLPVRRHHGP